MPLRRTPLLAAIALALAFCPAGSLLAAGAARPFRFITRSGDMLMEGNREFRFASFDVPDLAITEDPSWHRISAWEQEDAIRSVAQMGGRVIRIYTLSIAGGRRNARGPSHVIAPGEYDETLMRDYDRMIALCGKYRIRLIIPFIDQWHWWGGIDEFSRFRGKTAKDFYSDPRVQADFRALVKTLVTRVNTITRVPYNDDPTIMAWESGNELRDDPAGWTCSLAAYVKRLAPHQLFADGHNGPRPRTLDDPNVDLLTAHFYGTGNYAAMERSDRERTRGKKPFYVGEFDPRHAGTLIDEVVANGTAGILAWSLRGHSSEGGFFCHGDPLYYHWPYSPITRRMRRAAFEIRGVAEPPVAIPQAPELLPIRSPSRISWRGSTGADAYTLERALSPRGPWIVVATDLSDDRCRGPLFVDREAPKTVVLYYRLKASNASGASGYSPVVACMRTRTPPLPGPE